MVRDQQALISTSTDLRVQPNGTEGYRTAEVTLAAWTTNPFTDDGSAQSAWAVLHRRSDGIATGWLGAITSSGVVECMGLCAGFDRSELVLTCYLKMK
ncbi:hypothetical protein ACLB1N_26500 [Escherichia coli]